MCRPLLNQLGDEYPTCSYLDNRVIYIAKGSIFREMPATRGLIEMHPGERLELPHDVVYASSVGSHSATC